MQRENTKFQMHTQNENENEMEWYSPQTQKSTPTPTQKSSYKLHAWKLENILTHVYGPWHDGMAVMSKKPSIIQRFLVFITWILKRSISKTFSTIFSSIMYRVFVIETKHSTRNRRFSANFMWVSVFIWFHSFSTISPSLLTRSRWTIMENEIRPTNDGQVALAKFSFWFVNI